MLPPPERLLLPFAPGPFRMAMGLIGCPMEALVEIDALYDAEMAERREHLAIRHADVFATTPASAPARTELLEIITGLLTRSHPEWFGREGTLLRNELSGESWDLAEPAVDPLELCGRLVQEDLCLIDPFGPSPVLSAAILCAPSRWRLSEKIGRPLADVHGPVPLYAEHLSSPVDRFMGALRPGRVAERMNWGVLDDGALYQEEGTGRTAFDPSITLDVVPERLFLRVERQTLMRLPESGFVLFTIRVHSYPLGRVLAVPGAARDLAAAIEALPDSMTAYKSLLPFRDALLACLSRHANPDGAPA